MTGQFRKPRWLIPASLLSVFTLLAAGCSSSNDSAGNSGGGAPGATKGDPVKLGILGECKGPFGGFNQDTVAGVELALARYAGASVKSQTSALEGWTGATVDGTPIQLVGIGCGNDTPNTITEEVRQLVEQQGANVIIGPLSGDEGIAVAQYAKANPNLTVLSGIAGSQEPTLEVQAPNYFRFHGDGAMWNAGMGDILHNKEGWDTVAVIADDYSFGLTSAAGFIADFCGVGGKVTARVFPPLGTTDYSSYIAQLPNPDQVDGYFWAVGGTGTQAALEAFKNAKGDLKGSQQAGNLFFNPGLASALGTDIAGAYVGGFATLPGDVKTPAIQQYLASADKTWNTLPTGLTAGKPGPPSTAAGFGFMYGYYSAGVALVQALKATNGDPSPTPLQSAMSKLKLDLPYGQVSLDENRSGIVDVGISQLVNDNGKIVQKTVAIVPKVDQSFGGTFSHDTPPPGRDFPPCKTANLPWVGKEIPVVNGVPQQ